MCTYGNCYICGVVSPCREFCAIGFYLFVQGSWERLKLENTCQGCNCTVGCDCSTRIADYKTSTLTFRFFTLAISASHWKIDYKLLHYIYPICYHDTTAYSFLLHLFESTKKCTISISVPSKSFHFTSQLLTHPCYSILFQRTGFMYNSLRDYM